jgi:glycosyltransferase involved in cell wall biosynthesis
MKILHVNDHYHKQGGVERYLLSVGELLHSHGYENAVLYCKDHPGTIHRGRWPAHLVDDNEHRLEASIQAIVEEEHPDIAYIHLVSSAKMVSTISRLVPTVAYMHGFQTVCPGLAKYFRRGDEVCTRRFSWMCAPMHYLRRCSAARHPLTLRRLMVHTQMLKKAYMGVTELLVATPYGRSVLVQNGFDPCRISVLAPHFFVDGTQAQYRPPDDPMAVLYAGRLEVEKGIPYLLRAFAQISPSATLVVAGDGTLRPVYEQIARELGVSDRVRFLGWLSEAEMELAYQHCAVLVMPSICPEAFGKVGIEALAHGRPVVAFAVGGISDWLHDGVDGFLVDPGDVRELANRVAQLVNDQEHSVAMGQAGQVEVTERYSAVEHWKTLQSTFISAELDYG